MMTGFCLFFAPGASGKQYQNGENFQTSGKHCQDQGYLGQDAVIVEGAGRTYSADAGADVVKGSQHSGQIGFKAEAVQGYDQGTQYDNDHIGG